MNKASEQKKRHIKYPFINPSTFISAKDIKEMEKQGRNKSSLKPIVVKTKSSTKHPLKSKSWFELEAQKESYAIKYRAIRDEYGRILRTEPIPL